MSKELEYIIIVVCVLVIVGATGYLSNTLACVGCCFKKVQLCLGNNGIHQIELNQCNDHEHSAQSEESELDEVSCTTSRSEEVCSSTFSGEVVNSIGVASDCIIAMPS